MTAPGVDNLNGPGDLQRLRFELSRLANTRLGHAFTAGEQARYDLLCLQEERALLTAAP